MTSLTIAIVLSVLASVAYALAAVLQTRLANTAAPDGARSAGGLGRLLRNRQWWAAVALSAVGGGTHVLSLRYGPLTLVQPLGVLTLVFALPMSAVLLGRSVTAMERRGATLTVVGLAGILLLTITSGTGDPPGAAEANGLVLVLVLGVLALSAIAFVLRGTTAHSLGLAVASGTSSAAASALVRVIAASATTAGVAELAGPLVGIAVLGLGGLLLSQFSYGGLGLGAPLATMIVVNPVVSSVLGVVAFDEEYAAGVPGLLAALLAGAVSAYGVVVLARASHPGDGEREPGPDERGARPHRLTGHSGLRRADPPAR